MMTLIDFQIMEGRRKDGARGVGMKGGCSEAVKREASVSCMQTAALRLVLMPTAGGSNE